ncbi:uncharacterized protein LOC144286304 isoform X2 [Canis aureus]
MDVPVAGASPANRPCLRCDSKVNTPNLVEKADTNMNIRKGHVQWGQCYDRGDCCWSTATWEHPRVKRDPFSLLTRWLSSQPVMLQVNQTELSRSFKEGAPGRSPRKVSECELYCLVEEKDNGDSRDSPTSEALPDDRESY